MSFQIPHDQEDETGDEGRISHELSELRQSAKGIYVSASTIVGQWSTTGSEAGTPLTICQQQEVESWVEGISIADARGDGSHHNTIGLSSSSSILESWRSDKRTSTPTILTEPALTEELVPFGSTFVLEQLLEQGKLYYAQGQYNESYNCFAEAYRSSAGLS